MTRAKANTSMISSVRRLLRDTEGTGPVGSTAGGGAVMLLTRPLRPGREHWGRCRRRWRLAHRGLGRLRAWALDALDVLGRLVLLPGQRHRGLVGVVLDHPLLERGVSLLARADRGADVRDDRRGAAQAAGRVGG